MPFLGILVLEALPAILGLRNMSGGNVYRFVPICTGWYQLMLRRSEVQDY